MRRWRPAVLLPTLLAGRPTHADDCIGRPDGTACDDGNACTQRDGCVMDHDAPCDDGDTCNGAVGAAEWRLHAFIALVDTAQENGRMDLDAVARASAELAAM